MANLYKGPLNQALNWFLNHTFNDIYVIWFSSKKSQLVFQIDDHTDPKIIDKIVGIINNNDLHPNWERADYFFNTNEELQNDRDKPIETMTLCLDGSAGKTNFSDKIVIIQPFDNSIIHSDAIKVKPPKKRKINMQASVEEFEGQVQP